LSGGSSAPSNTAPFASPAAAAAPPAPAPAAPDYASIFANDPILKQLQANLAAQGISDAASRASARQQALIQFGEVPNFAQSATDLGLGDSFNTDINPSIAALANQNTAAGTSTYANLNHAYQTQVRQIKQALAAKGLLSSGETGYELGNAQHTYNQGLYDDTNKLLSYLTGVQQSYNTAQQNAQSQLYQGSNDAYNRAVAEAQAGTLPTPPPAAGSGGSGTGSGGTPPPADHSLATAPGASYGSVVTPGAIQRAIAGATQPSTVHYGNMQLGG
jgi:hypothetical protein